MHYFFKRVALRLLQAYKWAISPMFPPACRYQPTCSEYAMEAVDRFGVLRGSLMAAWRLLRCHPFASGGYDPVVNAESGCDHAVNGVSWKGHDFSPAARRQNHVGKGTTLVVPLTSQK